MNTVAFDPERHEDEVLFEVVGDLDEKGNYRTYVVASEIPFEQARRIPWYFVVVVDE